MCKRQILAALVACLAISRMAVAQTPLPNTHERGCLVCHEGIEPIREAGSKMLEEIRDQGDFDTGPEGCCVCHGGDSTATDKARVHGGDAFYADPSSPWINENTCGQCDPDHVRVQWHNLMMTETGKIQGVAWAFGSLTGYEHRWGNYAVENPGDSTRRLGTDAYRQYKQRLKLLQQEKAFRQAGLVAMTTVRPHLRQMECYTCQSSWTAQCYGCHVKVDYSGGKTSFDWLAAGHHNMRTECEADRGAGSYDTTIPGELSEEWLLRSTLS